MKDVSDTLHGLVSILFRTATLHLSQFSKYFYTCIYGGVLIDVSGLDYIREQQTFLTNPRMTR